MKRFISDVERFQDKCLPETPHKMWGGFVDEPPESEETREAFDNSSRKIVTMQDESAPEPIPPTGMVKGPEKGGRNR